MFDFFGLSKTESTDGNKDEFSDTKFPDITKFTRYDNNPIITPNPEIPWRSSAVYNPAAVFLEGKVHLIYRAQGKDKVSSLGYALSSDGFIIDENLEDPIFYPSKEFEKCTKSGWNSGCEDPRITIIGDRLYMTYTAYDGTNPPRVALTSIKIEDFLKRNWQWDEARLISPPGVDDKDSCIIKRSKGAGFVAFHRLGSVIWLDTLWDLEFPQRKFLTGGILAQARQDDWDNVKVGIAAPPIETHAGYILFYHAVSNPGFKYKIGAMLLDLDEPRKIIARTSEPLLEPEKPYETNGQVPNSVFSCGAIVKEGVIFLYYGGADSVTCVATMPLDVLLNVLLKQ